MKKLFLTICMVFATTVCLGSCGGYNRMVSLREIVDSQWANVENQYQRRNDLIPNLVATVQGYAKHEEQVFTAIAEARAKAGGVVSIDADITEDAQMMRQFQQVQDQLGSSLQRLLVISENYPELKANENFRDLQSQLEGTENRISTERTRYNDAVREYNAYIQTMPQALYAARFNFKPKEYFTAAVGAETAPTVSFE